MPISRKLGSWTLQLADNLAKHRKLIFLALCQIVSLSLWLKSGKSKNTDFGIAIGSATAIKGIQLLQRGLLAL